MLKIERDKLLVTAVLFVIISIDMINTSMLAPVLPSIPNFVPFFAIMLLLSLIHISEPTRPY